MGGRRRIVLSGAVAAALVISVTAAALGSDILPGAAGATGSQLRWHPQSDAEVRAEQPTGGQAPVASGTPAGDTTRPSATSTAQSASASIAYLRERYGVSEAEAIRRIELQRESTELAAKLSATFPDEYAGMWLDQAGGGFLAVGMTAPEKLVPAVTGLADSAHVRAVPAKRSLRQLAASAERIASELGVAAGGDVVVDVPSNSVVVTTGNAVRADDPRLAALLAGREARTRRVDEQSYVAKSCDPLHCLQAPMRGGIRLDVPRDDGTVGGCTTGFNVRSQTTGADYVLTAGHCVLGGRHTRVDDTWHEFRTRKMPVGVEDPNPGLVENNPGAGLDYSILPFQAGAQAFWWPRTGWGQRPRQQPVTTGSTVNYWCPGGCAGSHDVQITGLVPFAAIQLGWVVCATGAGYTPAAGEIYVDSGAGLGYVPGTHCGEITDKDSRIWVRICARPGDSGGPLFTEADGKALGILTGGDPGQGACTNAQERNYYAPVSSILDRANSRTGNSLNLQLLVTPTS